MVYVDDLFLISKSVCAIGKVQKVLEKSFVLKNLDPISDYLGISVQYDQLNSCMCLLQQIAIERALKRFHMQDSEPVLMPMEINFTALLRSKSRGYQRIECTERLLEPFFIFRSVPDLIFCFR